MPPAATGGGDGGDAAPLHLLPTTTDLRRFHPAEDGASPLDVHQGRPRGQKPATRQRRPATAEDATAGRLTAQEDHEHPWQLHGTRRIGPVAASPSAAGGRPPARTGLRHVEVADAVAQLSLEPSAADGELQIGKSPCAGGKQRGRHPDHMLVSAESPWASRTAAAGGAPATPGQAAPAPGGVRETPAGGVQQAHPWEITGRGLRSIPPPTEVYHSEVSLDSPWRPGAHHSILASAEIEEHEAASPRSRDKTMARAQLTPLGGNPSRLSFAEGTTPPC
eukprot:SAG22_NODE_325_length_12333_cov_263.779222_4_plen_278_part_00